jgi:hypothetical protein
MCIIPFPTPDHPAAFVHEIHPRPQSPMSSPANNVFVAPGSLSTNHQRKAQTFRRRAPTLCTVCISRPNVSSYRASIRAPVAILISPEYMSLVLAFGSA